MNSDSDCEYGDDQLVELVKRGYDKSTIERLRRKNELRREAGELAIRVGEAFRNVKLENGVGLLEADIIDSHGSELQRREARLRDESEDWSKISIDYLNAGSGLSFFDAAGLRFHLPAYVVAELSGKGVHSILSTLLSEIGRERFANFTVEQREVLREYLNFRLKDEDFLLNHEAIRQQLETYFSDDWARGEQ
jgi:hypothetical protein